MTELSDPPPLFATFPRRLLALTVDGLVWLAVIALAAVLGTNLPLGPRTRAALWIGCLLFALLYEPILVAWTGRTLGHRALNLRVVAETPTGRLSYGKAQLRWLMKVFTGVAAFITMPATRRSQALHDLPFGTTVQIHDRARATPAQYVEERPAPAGGPLPSPLRRALVSVGYAVFFFVLLIVATALTSSAECLDGRCTKGEELVSAVLSTTWFAGTILVAVLAWQGRMWGCRRGPVPVAVDSGIGAGAV